MSLVTSCGPPPLPTSSDSEDYALHVSENEHSDVEFAKEQSDRSVDTDGDDSDELCELKGEIKCSFDLENFVASSEFSVTSTSIPHVFASK